MTLLSKINMGQAGVLAASGIVVAICCLAAIFHTFPGDEGALRRFQEFRSPVLTDAAVAASYLAYLWVAIGSVIAVSLVLWIGPCIGRRRSDAVAVLLVFIPDGINAGLKELIARPRPELSLLDSSPESFAFPSGHSIHAFLFFGLLIFILGELIKPPWLRIGVQVLLGLAILSVGASRVYLGVHWPSDVIGGYLLGGFSLMIILWVRKKLFFDGRE